ncbi:MAG: hypothetical protein E6J01_15825 [Chloroflexi bacterium]|nr:MAG: hypothetical protein E6J01_15825 [Chloroflexota bacterium]
MEEVSQMKPRAVPMKLRGLISGALLSLILSPVVALGRPVVASAATADPMFQVQVPGVFKQSAFPVDATAGKSVPGVVTLADAESAIAGRGALSASAQGSLGSISNPGIQAIDLFTGGSGRAEFRLPDVTFSGPAPAGSTISASINFGLSGSLATSALHSFTSDALLISEASAGISGRIIEPTSFIGGSFGGQAKTVSKHLANGTLTSSLNREGVFGVESKTLPDASIAFVVPGGFTTDPLTVVIGKPMTLDVSLSVLGGITWDGILTGGDIGSGAANFGHTLSFPSSGPVFGLPSGFTVNSPSGLIVNNQYVTGTAPPDTTPPTTTASLSPAANANGWNNTAVTVNLSSADNAGGSGVKEISTSLSGAQTGSAVTPGSTASVTITEEGITTLTFFARDNAGNQETPQTVSVQTDKTAPTIAGSRLPLANAYGWNNSDVTVHFDCSDAFSSIAVCSSDVVLANEGANQAVIGSASDRAGNTANAKLSDINIDKTPPLSVATANPPANANGWNQTPVQIKLAATDALSGALSTEFSLDGAGFVPYASPLSVSGDGVHRLEFRSTDKAGNVEATQSVAVKIDQTAPEAYFLFDPSANDIVVFGRDALSGPSQSGPLAPITVNQQGGDEEAGDGELGHGRGVHHRAGWELRTYLVTDQAGNALSLTLRVSRREKGVSVRVVGLQYDGDPVVIPIDNKAHFRADLDRSGELRRVGQEIGLEGDKLDQTVHAVWDARRNQTRITVERDDHEIQTVMNGLVLLRLATSKGTLKIEF